MTEGTAPSIQGERASPKQRRGGRERTIDPKVAWEMYEEQGLSQAEIAEHFGKTRQAVSLALKKYRESENLDGGGEENAWPWKIERIHAGASNQLYRLMLAFRKWNAGREVSSDELENAKALQKAASLLGKAITYNPEKGFAWTDRRPGEEEEMFVVR